MNSSTSRSGSPRRTRSVTRAGRSRCGSVGAGPGGAVAKSAGRNVVESWVTGIPPWNNPWRLRFFSKHSGEDQGLEQIDRYGKDGGRVVFGRDLGERLQIAELHRERLGRENLGRLREFLARLKLPFRVDDLGAPLALGLGLARDRPLHFLRQVDVLHLDGAHLDPPRLGVAVNHQLQLLVDLVPVREQLIQLRLAERAPKE